MTPFDIAILGGGPGGYVAALHAGVKGAKVRTWRFRPVWGLDVADA